MESPAGSRTIPLGFVAILSGLSLNVIFLHLAVSELDWVRDPFLSFTVLLLAAVLLIYGVFWGPARAGIEGIALRSYLDHLIGPNASRLICWLFAPLALWVWFYGCFWAGIRILQGAAWDFHDGGGHFLGDFWVIVFGLVALVFVGMRGRLGGLARSSLWLSKIALVSLAGLAISYRDEIPAGIARVRASASDGAMEVGTTLGLMLLWFAVPLFLFGGLLRSGRPESDQTKRSLALSLHRIAWLGIGAALFVAIILAALSYLGALGKLPKVLGFAGAFQIPGELGTGKLLIASLSMLIALRLAPRILLELWRIPPKSMRASLIFGILVALCLATESWDLLPNGVASTLPIVSLAGVVAGWGAGRFLGSGGESETVLPGSVPGRIDGAELRARRLRTLIWVAAPILAVIIGDDITRIYEVASALWSLKLVEAGWALLVNLYGLHHIRDSLAILAGSLHTTVTVWAWSLSFISTLATTWWRQTR